MAVDPQMLGQLSSQPTIKTLLSHRLVVLRPLEDCMTAEVCTVVFVGHDPNQVDEITAAARSAVSAITLLLDDPSVVPGGYNAAVVLSIKEFI